MDHGIGSFRSGTAGLALILVATASLWQAATPSGAAAAQNDLSFTSASTWTALPSQGRVLVEEVMWLVARGWKAAGFTSGMFGSPEPMWMC